MEILLRDGDYVPDGKDGFERVSGDEETLFRALYKLSARRAAFSPMPELGSRLYTLARIRKADRENAARQFAAEALSDERVVIDDVKITETDDGLNVCVSLSSNGAGVTANIAV